MNSRERVLALLDGTPGAILRELGECHLQAGERFVVGAGCEVPRDTPRENVQVLSAYARGLRP